MSERFYTRKDVADMIRMSESWVKKQTLSGALPCFYFGKACRIRESALVPFFHRHGFDVVKIVGNTSGYDRIPSSKEVSDVLEKIGGVR